jgi:hypothetical protein
MQEKESAMSRQPVKEQVAQPDRGPIPAEILADLEEVCRLAAQGGATDPELLRCITERADKARAEVRQQFGVQDIGVQIIRDSVRDSVRFVR